MNIHEYQAKAILKKYGLTIPYGFVAESLDELHNNINHIATNGLVIKAQIHAGGRGKIGGVKVCQDKHQSIDVFNNMLHSTLHTTQGGDKKVNKILIEEIQNIVKEYYISLVCNRENSNLLFIASSEGGMDIEKVAERHPEKVIKLPVNPTIGLCDFHIRELFYSLGFDQSLYKKFHSLITTLYKVYVENDLTQLEINPLILNNNNDFICLDAKFDIDDNALFRQPELRLLEDLNEKSPLEIEADTVGLNYIKMDGEVACMVNGAGLAMATMDMIKLHGGNPANFLDVGGTATEDRVSKAIEIILSDTNVKSILINIMGGIVRCDIIARGVIQAMQKNKTAIPLIFRVDGTNAEIAYDILQSSGIEFFAINDMEKAVDKAVLLSK